MLTGWMPWVPSELPGSSLMGGTLGRELYHPDDPFCRSREPDDGKWNLDHFYRKLLKLESGMHTESAKKLAATRTAVLRRYLLDLEEEIGTNYENGYENNKKTKVIREQENLSEMYGSEIPE